MSVYSIHRFHTLQQSFSTSLCSINPSTRRSSLCTPCFFTLNSSRLNQHRLFASSIAQSQDSDIPTNISNGNNPHLRYGIASQQGPRDTMEDVTEVIENGRCGFLFATVFDGHAGDAAAQYLKTNLYKIFSEVIDMHGLGLDCSIEQKEEGLCCPVELRSVLTQSYKQADDTLLQWLQQQDEYDACSGCTATTALIRSDRIIVANVGDSRAVLCRSSNAIDLSTEHRVYGRGPVVESETLRVQHAGGWIDDGRVCGVLAVSRAFGDSDFKGEGLERLLIRGVEDEMWSADFAAAVNFTSDPVIAEPDVYEMPVVQESDEFLVVATDGLWDVLSSQEAVKLARSDLLKGKHPREAAERLATVAVRRYTADNVAVVVVDLLGEQGWKELGENTKKPKLFGLF